ncbi:hypothetical protein ABK040_007760 [Willaertia magna]
MAQPSSTFNTSTPSFPIINEIVDPTPRPMPNKNITLEGKYIRLKPFNLKEDIEELYEISHGTEEKESIWRYLFTGKSFPSLDAFSNYFEEREKKQGLIFFTVIDKQSNRKIGSVSYLNIVPNFGCLELGSIWYCVEFHRTYANTESCFLLMYYVFNKLNYRRVEWKCNAKNERSANAAKKLGFTFEGTFRKHMILWNGESRDSLYFSLLDDEWKEDRMDKLMKRLDYTQEDIDRLEKSLE